MIAAAVASGLGRGLFSELMTTGFAGQPQSVLQNICSVSHLFLPWLYNPATQPSECGRQRTLNSVHGHTAAQLQSNGNLAV